MASRPKYVSSAKLGEVSRKNGYYNRLSTTEMKTELFTLGACGIGCKEVLLRRLKSVFAHRSGVPPSSPAGLYFDAYIVVDFEATCSESTYGPPGAASLGDTKVEKEEQEIIEFPACLIDCERLEITDTFHKFVQPVLNRKLTPYCTTLTGISQAQVDAAETFPVVLAQFEGWLKSHGLLHKSKKFVLVTDGPSDVADFLFNSCMISGVSFPSWAKSWVNIKRTFCGFYNFKRVKLTEMLTAVGLPLVGRLHSGIDDTKNIAALALYTLLDGCQLRPNQRIDLNVDPITKKVLNARVSNITLEEFRLRNCRVRHERQLWTREYQQKMEELLKGKITSQS